MPDYRKNHKLANRSNMRRHQPKTGNLLIYIALLAASLVAMSLLNRSARRASAKPEVTIESVAHDEEVESFVTIEDLD